MIQRTAIIHCRNLVPVTLVSHNCQWHCQAGQGPRQIEKSCILPRQIFDTSHQAKLQLLPGIQPSMPSTNPMTPNPLSNACQKPHAATQLNWCQL
jgi:hypothetical protein